MFAKSLVGVNGLRPYVFRMRGRVTVCVGEAYGLPGFVVNPYAVGGVDRLAVAALAYGIG